MALGGLLETLATPLAVDDGWGSTYAMTHRAFTVIVGLVPDFVQPDTTADPIVARVHVTVGKVVAGSFRVNRDLVAPVATFRRSELVALSSITIPALIDAAKTKLGLT